MSDQNGIERAKKLLQRLRLRTEERGATAAEAQQAAQLADKICQRYGLDKDKDSIETTTESIDVDDVRRHDWLQILIGAISSRFDLVSSVHGRREAWQVKFTGPQYRVSVARWLFEAITNDMAAKCRQACRDANVKGGQLVRFRREFKISATMELHKRLNPVQHAKAVQRAQDANPKGVSTDHVPSWQQPNYRPMTQAEARQLKKDLEARLAGKEFGQSVSIDDKAVGGGEIRLIEQRQKGSA